MAEYIDRNAVLTKLKRDYVPIDDRFPMTFSIVQIADVLSEIPAADVAPVQHGQWLLVRDYDGDGGIKCSRCGTVWHSAIMLSLEDWRRVRPYCSDCGAKMDGGLEDD